MKLNLLLQLDCALDARLAVLGSYDPTIPKRILGSAKALKEYRGRLIDDFSKYGVSREKFKELWSQRTTAHLRGAPITPMVFELTDIIEQVYDQFRAAPHTISGFELLINHYPYTELTEAELDALSDAFQARFKNHTIIRWICEPVEKLTPFYWEKENIATAFMYDFEEWLVAHYGTGNELKIASYEMPRNTVYAPALFTSLEKLREAADFENPNGKRADPLESIQFWLKPYFHLEWLGVEHFCILDPDLFVAMELHNFEIVNGE